MQFDDEAWERSDSRFDAWKKDKLFNVENLKEAGKLIAKRRSGVAQNLFSPKRGAFNVWLSLKFEDGGSAVMRVPCPGVSMFPEEKSSEKLR